MKNIFNINDYYAFGSPLTGRSFVKSPDDKYSYGMSGKMKNDEINGEGNSVDFGERMLDTRLGRWLSTDPKSAKYPAFSPYNYCANSPLLFIDRFGEDLIVAGTDEQFQKFKATLEVQFHGLIEIRRDEHNKVTMHIRETEGMNAGVSKETINTMIDMEKKKELYTQLEKVMSDEGVTNIRLKNSDGDTQGGTFRGSKSHNDDDNDFNGKPQSVDIDDMYARKDWKVGSGAGAILHEILEAFNDQVINGSPVACTYTEYLNAYYKAHYPVLAAQAKVDGYDTQINGGRSSGSFDIGQIFSMKINVDASGNITESWYLTEYIYDVGPQKGPRVLRSEVPIENVRTKTNGTATVICGYNEKKQ